MDTTIQYGAVNFAGMGIMIFLSVAAYWLYQIAKLYRGYVENELRYSVLEDVMLTRYVKEKGIDLNKEMIKRDFLRKPSKNIKQKIQAEIYDSYFKDNDKKGE